MGREDLAADIPPDLQPADALLTRYGRWATASGGSSCSILGRMYIREADRKESLEAYNRRRANVPGQAMLTTQEALKAQRALAAVPDTARVVLSILYVPRRQPVEMQLRLLRIPPMLCRERHLHGLRMFWNLHRLSAPPSGRRGADCAGSGFVA